MEKNIKFGILLPIPTIPPQKLIKIAKINEEAGFDSIWSPDHLLFIPQGITPNAWVILSAISASTSHVYLGTSVSDPHRYHPAVLAQILATLDQISGGRIILGLGAGEAMNLDPYGISWDKPIARLIEAINIMRRLWRGERFNFEGKFWNMKDAFLQITPINKKIPIYIGANKEKMLRLTGKLADGWIPTPLTPELYSKRLKIIKDSAERAGRNIEEIDTAIYLYTCISENIDEVYNRLEQFKPMVVPSPEVVKEAGYNIEIPKNFKPYHKILPKENDIIPFMEYGAKIPVEAAIDFSISGTVDQCIEKIEKYIKAGVKHFILINVGPDIKYVLKVYSEEIIPYFKEKS